MGYKICREGGSSVYAVIWVSQVNWVDLVILFGRVYFRHNRWVWIPVSAFQYRHGRGGEDANEAIIWADIL